MTSAPPMSCDERGAALLSHVPHMAPWAHLPRIARQAPLVSIVERAAPCSHRRYPTRSQRLQGRIRFPVISWQATQRAESPLARINRGASRSPAHSGVIQRAVNGFEGAYASPLFHGRLTRHTPIALSSSPLQRPTSPYLSGSVISCTAPSSFSSIHPPRTASGGVALRQLRRAVIS